MTCRLKLAKSRIVREVLRFSRNVFREARSEECQIHWAAADISPHRNQRAASSSGGAISPGQAYEAHLVVELLEEVPT